MHGFILKGAVAVAAIVIVSALAVWPAAASAMRGEIAISGVTSTLDPGSTNCVSQGPFVLTCESTGFLTGFAGTLTGSSSTDSSTQLNCKTGRYHGHGVETFTGSLAGAGSGTLTWQLQTSGTISDDCSALTSFEGRGIVVGGTGGLAGLHGAITFDATSYVGSLQ